MQPKEPRRRFQGLRDFWLAPPPPLGPNFGADAEGIWAFVYRIGIVVVGLTIAILAAGLLHFIQRGYWPF
jgi:hypothetical protein